VYRHFPDRRALVAAIVGSCFADSADTLNRAAAGAGDPFEGLRRRCYTYLAYGRAHPRVYRVLFGAWSTGPKTVGTYGRSPHPGATAFTDLVNAIECCRQFLAFHCGRPCTASSTCAPANPSYRGPTTRTWPTRRCSDSP
jgi:AcrR family transcriptional regulator